MTCIVGMETADGVMIAGDSASATNSQIVPTKLDKVFEISSLKEKMIIGYTSSFRMGQLLEYSFRPPKRKEFPYVGDLEYLATSFIDEVRKVLKEGGYSEVDNNREKGGFFLVGYKGNLYEINSDFQVNSSAIGYNAVGSGKYYALGSLYNSVKNSVDPEEALFLALEAAERFNPFVIRPFKIMRLQKNE